MGLDTIEDRIKRNEWEVIIAKLNEKLNENHFNLDFLQFKNDGSYAKAKLNLPAVYFAFAQDQKRCWVELELKERKKEKQIKLYEYIRKNYTKNLHDTSYNVTWDEDDEQRNKTSNVIRIKIYLKNKDKHKWPDAMIVLINTFLPILNKSRSLTNQRGRKIRLF